MINLPKAELTQSYLQAVFDLNPAGDRLLYRFTFPMRHWKAGEPAGCYHGKAIRVKIDSQPIDIRRLIHLYKTGELLPLVKLVPPTAKATKMQPDHMMSKAERHERQLICTVDFMIAEHARSEEILRNICGYDQYSDEWRQTVIKLGKEYEKEPEPEPQYPKAVPNGNHNGSWIEEPDREPA